MSQSRVRGMGRHVVRQALPLGLVVAVMGSWAAAQSTKAAPSTKAPTKAAAPKASSGSEVDRYDVSGYINKLIRQGYADHEMTPSSPCTEGEWVRRVYLDVLGRIPSVEEAKAYLGEKGSDRKAKLIDKLLNSDQYIEEYGKNFATKWTNLLIGRAGGGNASLAKKEGLEQYLRRAFLTNKTYDAIVTDLITASGSNTPGQQGYNGAVNFLLNEIDLAVPPNERTARVTAKVAKIFLGLQVQCTQCHNHPFNDWKQDQFWTFDAFFRQMQQVGGRANNNNGAVVQLVDRDFSGETRNPREADIFYEQRNGLLRVAYPTFVDGTEINRSGVVSDVNRRQELARLVVKSEWFAKATVNRMWMQFMGYGFTKPVDDMGPHNPASHPELLDRLAKDFAQHQFDLKTLIKWVVLSEPYSLSSKTNEKNKADDPAAGNPPVFSRFYLRQMEAEELFDSLLIATGAAGQGTLSEAQQKDKSDWMKQFITTFETDEGGETTSFNGTIPQALMMMNSPLIRRATSTDAGTFLSNLAASKQSDAQKINQMFMAGLTRTPSAGELQYAQNLWKARGGNTIEALKDVWWAVLNSNEFILNH